MPDSQNVIELAKKVRADLLKRDAAAIERIVNAYRGVYKSLQGEIDALVLVIEKGKYTKAELIRLSQYRNLVREMNNELKRFGSFLATELRTNTDDLLALGLVDGRRLISASFQDATGRLVTEAAFKTVSQDALKNIIAFLDKGGPLYDRLSKLPDVTAEKTAQLIINGVAMGKNPRAIAYDIQTGLGGGLTDAMRMMRTAQLYSYREANRASYAANSDIVKGWIWYAELDGSTCASCIALHGSFHEIDEVLDDHHNGRCSMIPVTFAGDPGIQSGEEWFKEQDESTQKGIMGAGKFDAWQAGKFDFASLSTSHTDDVYGNMRTETPLKDLIGE